MLVIDVCKQVGQPGGIWVHIHIADHQFTVHNQLLAQHIAVQIGTVVTVVVADEVDDITVGYSVHGLGQGLGFPIFVDPAHTNHAAVRIRIGKFHHQFSPLGVIQDGNPAGDAVVDTVVHGGLMVVGDRLMIDGEPGDLTGGISFCL